jgi:hypothetical protein
MRAANLANPKTSWIALHDLLWEQKNFRGKSYQIIELSPRIKRTLQKERKAHSESVNERQNKKWQDTSNFFGK